MDYNIRDRRIVCTIHYFTGDAMNLLKRLLPVLFVCLCLTLSACGGNDIETRYGAFSQELSQSESLSFNAALRAEYEDRSVDFTLNCRRDSSGCTVTVLEPEIVAGIKATLKPGSSGLEFQSMILDTGDLDNRGLTPMSALPALARAMESAHLESCWEEAGLYAVQLIADDHLSASVWFQPETMEPLRAELISDGHVTVKCDISEWSM